MRNTTILRISISTPNPQPQNLPYMMLWILCRVTDTESYCILQMRNIVRFRIWGIQPYYPSVSLHRIHSLYLYHIWCCGFCVELLTQNLVVFFRCGIWQYSTSVSLHRIRSLYLYCIWCCGFCVELLTQNPVTFSKCGIWQYSTSVSLHRIRNFYLYYIWCIIWLCSSDAEYCQIPHLKKSNIPLLHL